MYNVTLTFILGKLCYNSFVQYEVEYTKQMTRQRCSFISMDDKLHLSYNKIIHAPWYIIVSLLCFSIFVMHLFKIVTKQDILKHNLSYSEIDH